MHCCQEVILLVVQHSVLHGDTRRHQFRNASLDEFLRQFGVFQLVADGHTFTSTNQLRQVGVQRMMGKARHLVALIIAIVTMRQRNA